MIPYFREHLLNYQSSKKLDHEIPDSSIFKQEFAGVLGKARNGSKMDLRILKNIDFYEKQHVIKPQNDQ